MRNLNKMNNLQAHKSSPHQDNNKNKRRTQKTCKNKKRNQNTIKIIKYQRPCKTIKYKVTKKHRNLNS